MSKKRDIDGHEYSTDEITTGRIARRIILEADKNIINPSMHVGIDITGVANANSQYPVILLVQEKCNLGDWHTTYQVHLPPWGKD